MNHLTFLQFMEHFDNNKKPSCR